MRYILLSSLALVTFVSCNSKTESTSHSNQVDPLEKGDSVLASEPSKTPEYPIIVLHGGAGSITKERMANGLETQYRNALDSAIIIGSDILQEGGSSVLAVEKTINFLEDHPLFNAGKGAVLAANGNAELDASIMDGSNLMAGAVAGVTTVKNPISLARMVKDSTKHVLLSREGAENFAIEMKVEPIEPEYFITPKTREKREMRVSRLDKMGTVGCVAIDKNGNIAAGTSTGGMDNKKYGRIGDSPIIGAGTYADNATCGVSCTGHGEYFIKNAVAYDMSALIKYQSKTSIEAADLIINQKLVEQKALGGLVAIDKDGNIAIDFNTQGMFWAYKKGDKESKVGMYGSDVID